MGGERLIYYLVLATQTLPKLPPIHHIEHTGKGKSDLYYRLNVGLQNTGSILLATLTIGAENNDEH